MFGHIKLYSTWRTFRSQTSDSMDRWKRQVERVREEQRRRKKIREEKEPEKRRCRSAKRKNSRQSLCFLPMICGSGWLKSRLTKAAGVEPSTEMRWKIARCCGAKQISKSKCAKHTNVRYFWKLRCSKSARCCGGLGALFEVRMWFWTEGARYSAPSKKRAKHEGFVAV